MSEIHINDAEYILLSEVRKQCDELQAENDQLKSMTYCAYCGKEYPLDDNAASQVSGHIKTCEKHPMRKLQDEITTERQKYLDLVCQVIKATGIDVPTGGMTAVEATKRLQAENERLIKIIEDIYDNIPGAACDAMHDHGIFDEWKAYREGRTPDES